jgi:hypothetical protein
MAVQARMHVVVGQSSAGVSIPVWPGRPAADAPDGPWYAWRLLGRNNRELGRSPRVFGTARECVAAIGALRARVAELEAVVVVDAVGMWGWRAELDGTPVAVASRPYYRQRESRYSLQQFLAEVAGAEVPPEPVRRRGGPRRARGGPAPVSPGGPAPPVPG